ncbi:MAG: hypothetical protein LBC18_02610 [Opitutaceae bacterium]|jgi:hypothetical protein|nr:hypothetical protein [Opitutaceae bacterium]
MGNNMRRRGRRAIQSDAIYNNSLLFSMVAAGPLSFEESHLRRAFDGAATLVAESPRSGRGVATSAATTNTAPAPPSAEWKMKKGEWKMKKGRRRFPRFHFAFFIPHSAVRRRHRIPIGLIGRLKSPPRQALPCHASPDALPSTAVIFTE